VRLIPMRPARRGELVDHVAAVTRAVVFGSLLTRWCRGCWWASASRSWAAVAGGLRGDRRGRLADPVVGTALVWVPAVGVLFLQGRWVAALVLAVWSVAVVSSADNVVRPLFISGRAQISTLPVFLGLLGGVTAFGPIGLVVGPVVVALTSPAALRGRGARGRLARLAAPPARGPALLAPVAHVDQLHQEREGHREVDVPFSMCEPMPSATSITR